MSRMLSLKHNHCEGTQKGRQQNWRISFIGISRSLSNCAGMANKGPILCGAVW